MTYALYRLLPAILLIPLSSANAHFLSGNDLVAKLAGPPVEFSYAVGFVTGVADAQARQVVLGIAPKAEGPFDLCFVIPESVTVGQLVAIVSKYLQDNPNTRHFPASGLVAAAIAKAFPCER